MSQRVHMRTDCTLGRNLHSVKFATSFCGELLSKGFDVIIAIAELIESVSKLPDDCRVVRRKRKKK